jgi:UDP-glucose 4-epimerase
MKVIIFGGSGFLGSHVADCLTSQGHSVTIFDLKPSVYLQPKQKMIVGDILDANVVMKAIEGHDVVYNFAGIADINTATSKPVETVQTNVMGTIYILDACQKLGVKRFIFASTVYVYSKSGSFYRASKQSCELFIESFHKRYGLDFTILRYGSLYGPRADESNWIYVTIRQALAEKKIIRKGDGEEIREYIHVTDAAQLTAKMLDKEFSNQHVIITGQQAMRVKDVLLMIKEILGNNININYVPSEVEEHYEITPYNFEPKFARKLTDNRYVDFGQGILEILNLEYEKISKNTSSEIARI